MRRAAWALALVLAVAALAGCLGRGLVGQPSPHFELVDSLGETVNESTYRGRFVILDLMATWCAPCILEVGHLREIQRGYGDRVAILSIGVDPTESSAQLDQFAKDHGATWAHALDFDGKVGRAFHLGNIPKLVILDPAGTVIFERENEVLPSAIARAIDPNGAPPETRAASETFAISILCGAVGFLAVLNPYRRFHRESAARWPAWAALGLLAALALLAWRFAGVVSARATYGSLALGAVALGAVPWWMRARRRSAQVVPHGPTWAHAGRVALDRAYEAGAHFALAIVFALSTTGLVGIFAPLVAFLVGMAAGIRARPALPERQRTIAGLVGLSIVGLGLLANGARILFAGL